MQKSVVQTDRLQVSIIMRRMRLACRIIKAKIYKHKIQSGPKVGIKYIIYYTLYAVYLLLAHHV
jgi:hypothetical protein